MSDEAQTQALDDLLVADGRYVAVETIGRVSGAARRVVLGFVDVGHGCLHVAAASDSDHWARNLRATPECAVERAADIGRYVATPLNEDQRAATIAALILKYGTPSERLGDGPAFGLCPIDIA